MFFNQTNDEIHGRIDMANTIITNLEYLITINAEDMFSICDTLVPKEILEEALNSAEMLKAALEEALILKRTSLTP